MISALYVIAGGVYSGRPDVDPWDVSRDARKYAGPWPVVAHPPCERWGAFATINYRRWGGDHNRPGNDGGCFRSALSCVRRFGGVLEHPAKSRAWETHDLPKPMFGSWKVGTMGDDWVTEVCQSAYGHRAMKATWLYVRGLKTPPHLRWDRVPGTHQCGFYDQRGKDRNKPTLPRNERMATPPAFAELLISIARSAGGSP